MLQQVGNLHEFMSEPLQGEVVSREWQGVHLCRKVVSRASREGLLRPLLH